MLWAILLSLAGHHGEPADPDLLDWIKNQLDHLLNLGPWTIVGVLASLIVAIPLSVLVFYVVQQRRRPGSGPPLAGQG
ncbi:MAG: hypothetical protein AAB528_00235 [Chloroflexota bacterium]